MIQRLSVSFKSLIPIFMEKKCQPVCVFFFGYLTRLISAQMIVAFGKTSLARRNVVPLQNRGFSSLRVVEPVDKRLHFRGPMKANGRVETEQPGPTLWATRAAERLRRGGRPASSRHSARSR